MIGADVLPIRLQILSKWPVPERVNTRLQTAISAQLATELQWVWLRHTWALARQFDACAELWLDQYPDPEQPFGQVFIQPEGDLGQRMSVAAQSAFSASKASLIIGTDCPFLDLQYLQYAKRALQEYEVVLGPAQDGGYVLIGQRRPVPVILQSIPWSTDRVLAATLDRLDANKISYKLLDTLYDIDRPEDLSSFLHHLAAKNILGSTLYLRLQEALKNPL